MPYCLCLFFRVTAPPQIYTLSLHDALPIYPPSSLEVANRGSSVKVAPRFAATSSGRSEEHTSELQSQSNLVCRLLLDKKKNGSVAMLSCGTAVTDGAVGVSLWDIITNGGIS